MEKGHVKRKAVSESPHRDFFNEMAEIWDNSKSRTDLSKIEGIVEGLRIARGSRILDVGTGTGIMLKALREATGREGHITAIDIAEKMLQEARKNHGEENIQYVHADISNTGFADNSFDYVICNACFPHIKSRETAVREMLRVLKKSGVVIVCHSMNRNALNSMHKTQGSAVENDYLPNDSYMKNLFESNGAVDVSINENNDVYVLKATKA